MRVINGSAIVLENHSSGPVTPVKLALPAAPTAPRFFANESDARHPAAQSHTPSPLSREVDQGNEEMEGAPVDVDVDVDLLRFMGNMNIVKAQA